MDADRTGVLLFDGERFVPYLEGPEDDLSVAYSRVLGASSHTAVVELQRGRVGNRRMPIWPMRWLPIQPHELGQLETLGEEKATDEKLTLPLRAAATKKQRRQPDARWRRSSTLPRQSGL